MKPKDYDTTVARIAGNVMAGMMDGLQPEHDYLAVVRAVTIANDIVNAVRHLESTREKQKS